MNTEEINALKREHNELLERGQTLYAELEVIRDKICSLRDRIQEAEGDDYDGVPLIFGCGYEIYD